MSTVAIVFFLTIVWTGVCATAVLVTRFEAPRFTAEDKLVLLLLVRRELDMTYPPRPGSERAVEHERLHKLKEKLS